MFAYIDKPDKKIPSIIYRNYYLTQGDSFTLTASPTNEDDLKLIEKVLFKIADANSIMVYEQKFSFDTTNNIFVCDVASEVTQNWEVTEDEPYIYEIEIHFVDGGVETARRADFTIWQQNKEA